MKGDRPTQLTGHFSAFERRYLYQKTERNAYYLLDSGTEPGTVDVNTGQPQRRFYDKSNHHIFISFHKYNIPIY